MIVQNAYDSFGTVTQQLSQGDPTKPWNFHIAGRVSVQLDPQGARTVYYYDEHHRLVALKDPNGNKSSTVYDGQDHAIQKISPLNEVAQFAYDGNQNLLQITDPLMNTASFIYDPYNFNLLTKTDFNQKSASYTYNNHFQVQTVTAPNVNNDPGLQDQIIYNYNPSDGTLASIQDQDGKITQFQYDSFGQVNRITYPNTTDYETSVNSSRGNVVSHTDANGVITSNAYNSRRQLTNSTMNPTGLNLVTQRIYDNSGNLAQTIDPHGNKTSYTYSRTGKQLTQMLPTLPDGSTPVYQSVYDTRDWLVQKIDSRGKAVTYGYDPGERMISVTDPLNNQMTYGFDNDDHQTSIQTALQAQNQATQYGYNACGDRTSMTDANNLVVNYTYDNNGKPQTVVNRNNGTFTSTYYDDGRLWTTKTPLGKTTTLTYIKRGMLATVTKPSQQGTGQKTTRTYDDRGRLYTQADPVGSSTLGYDKNNNLLTHVESRSGASYTIARTFDNANRLKTYIDESGNQIGYLYDNNGNLVTMTYPGNKSVNYTYDSNNRLILVKDWANHVTTYAYDIAGRMTSATRPNGTVRTLTYDDDGRATSILEGNASGGAIAYYKLGYDEVGRVKTEFAAPVPAPFTEATESVSYDADNRISVFNGHNVVYDDDGNMTSGPLMNDTPVGYGYDARNRLTSAGGLTYGYDSEGNRTGITQSGQTTRFVIDSTGLPKVLVRIKPDNTRTYYIYGQGLMYQMDDAGNMLTYHADSRGSTVAITDGTGTVTDRVEYNTYGLITSRTGTSDTPFLFNGRFGVMTDANGLYYMRARFYNPYIKRFVNPDPSGFGGGLNFYAYANGNPVSYLDPFGLSAWYDSWGVSVGQWVSTAQTFYGNNLPWGVAGALNTGISVVGGIASSPQAIGHVGEGSGTFSANPTLANSAGVFSDISIAAGTLAGGLSPIAAANTPIGYGNVVYRYASAGEIANTGDFIPNTFANSAPKPVYVTPDAPLSSTSQAVGNYQLDGSQSYIVAGDASGIDFYGQGQVPGGSGIQWLTDQQIPVISINRIGYNLQYGTAAAGFSWLGGNVSGGSSTAGFSWLGGNVSGGSSTVK
jgi:RHS repeat-associated protein